MHDLIVIGSGPGGYVAAIRAAQLGMRTGIVEKEKTFGGTCLNVGCIPSKALLYSSEQVYFFQKKGKEHGIKASGLSIDFQQMMRRKEGAVESLVNGVAGLLKRNKVETFKGIARFLSPEEIEVSGQQLRAKYFILATGSAPIPLPFFPFDEQVVLSSTGALSLSKIPKRMIVVGGGVIGVELASVYSRLGAEVTVVEMLDSICPAMDAQISKGLLQILSKQNITFHLGAKVVEAVKRKNEAVLTVELKDGKKELKGDAVLVAIGRRPYTEGLGLKTIGIEIAPQGFVQVDSCFRTSQPHILAIGDLIEGAMLAHRASEEGVAAVEGLAGLKPRVQYISIPNVIYTHPEVAAVGITEEEGKAFGLDLLKGICHVKGNPRSRCTGESEGLVKVIGDKATGRLLGLHILAPQASEMIGEGVIALEKRIKLEELAAASHAHPTLSESIKEAALQALGRALHL